MLRFNVGVSKFGTKRKLFFDLVELENIYIGSIYTVEHIIIIIIIIILKIIRKINIHQCIVVEYEDLFHTYH